MNLLRYEPRWWLTIPRWCLVLLGSTKLKWWLILKCSESASARKFFSFAALPAVRVSNAPIWCGLQFPALGFKHFCSELYNKSFHLPMYSTEYPCGKILPELFLYLKTHVLLWFFHRLRFDFRCFAAWHPSKPPSNTRMRSFRQLDCWLDHYCEWLEFNLNVINMPYHGIGFISIAIIAVILLHPLR